MTISSKKVDIFEKVNEQGGRISHPAPISMTLPAS